MSSLALPPLPHALVGISAGQSTRFTRTALAPGYLSVTPGYLTPVQKGSHRPVVAEPRAEPSAEPRAEPSGCAGGAHRSTCSAKYTKRMSSRELNARCLGSTSHAMLSTSHVMLEARAYTLYSTAGCTLLSTLLAACSQHQPQRTPPFETMMLTTYYLHSLLLSTYYLLLNTYTPFETMMLVHVLLTTVCSYYCIFVLHTSDEPRPRPPRHSAP